MVQILDRLGRTLRPVHLLVFFGVTLAAVTAAWIFQDNSLLSFGDSGADHTWPLYVAHALRLGGIPGGLQVLGDLHPTWPPGLFFMHGLLGYLLGEDLFWMRLYNLLYLPLLIWGVYRLGLQFGDAQTATLASALAVFNFAVAFHLRHICIDTPSMVMTVLAMFGLMRAGDLDRPRPVVLMGALFGLGLLFRVQFLFFVAGPALLAGVGAMRTAASGRERLRRLGWVGLAVLAAALVSSPFWASQISTIIDVCLAHLGHGVIGESTSPGESDPASGYAYYLPAVGQMVGWPMVLTVLGTVPLLIRRVPRSSYLVAWIAGGLLVTALGTNHEPRYLLPLVPALALLAALGLEQLRPVWRGLMTTTLLLATALPTLAVAGFGREVKDHGFMARLVHPDFVRAPVRRPFVASLAATQGALDRLLTRPDGEGLCLFFGGFAQEDLIAFFAPRYPRALLVTLQDNGDNDYPRWKRVMARPRRRLVVSVYQKYRLPLLWQGRYNHLPIYIHELSDPYLDVLRFSPPLDIDVKQQMEEQRLRHR